MITHCLTVDENLRWSLFVHNHEVQYDSCSALASIPSQLTSQSFSRLLFMIDRLPVCAGHPDYNFVRMISAKKGVLRSHTGAASAILDEYAPVILNGEMFAQTVRSATCAMVVHDVKCKSCKNYRATLRALYSRWTSRGHSFTTDTTSHVNERYMTSPEMMEKMKGMKKRIHTAESELRNLQKKLQELTQQRGEKVDNNLHNDLLFIMRENTDTIRGLPRR